MRPLSFRHNYSLIVYANNQSSVSTGKNHTNRKDCKTPITNSHNVVNDTASVLHEI